MQAWRSGVQRKEANNNRVHRGLGLGKAQEDRSSCS